jgi:hypothetical protein
MLISSYAHVLMEKEVESRREEVRKNFTAETERCKEHKEINRKKRKVWNTDDTEKTD